MIAARGEID